MSSNKVVNASIVLYKNGSDGFHRLYESLRAAPEIGIIYVVDNSPVPCIDAARYRDIEYYHRPDNPGYGGGHNVALRRSMESSAYHVVLNPDIAFEPGIFASLVKRMEADDAIGLIMPLITYPSGDIQYLCRLLPDPAEMVARRFLQPLAKGRLRRMLEKKDLRFTGYRREMDVPFLSGCFMFLRTTCLRDVGLFDERYFMYAEDLDLSRRINERYRTLFFPSVSVVHAHARSSYRRIDMMLHHAWSIIQYFNKWGWFFDRGRRNVNAMTLRLLGSR